MIRIATIKAAFKVVHTDSFFFFIFEFFFSCLIFTLKKEKSTQNSMLFARAFFFKAVGLFVVLLHESYTIFFFPPTFKLE